MMQYDDIVVGGGSSGAVLAARLAEDRSRKVLLIEAGPDFKTVQETPAALLDARVPVFDDYSWDYEAVTARARMDLDSLKTASRGMLPVSTADSIRIIKGKVMGRGRANPRLMRIPYFLGKVMGGGSTVNGAVAIRGLKTDFEQWSALGNDQWSWDKVLPFYRRIETDSDVSSEEHGDTGPIPIRRPRPDELTPLQRDYLQLCIEKGMPEVADFNGSEASGVGPVPLNERGGHRISTAISHLLPKREQKNLSIEGQRQVVRVLFEGTRAIGVELLRDGTVERVLGNRVTLCAGAINSPAILVRSGVGPPDLLARLNVELVIAAPGVGQSLFDHPADVIWAVPKPGVCPGCEPYHQVFSRYTADGSTSSNDLMQFMLSDVDVTTLPLKHMFGARRGFALSTVLADPRSRGNLVFTSADPRKQPKIILNCLAEAEDARRMMAGVRRAWELLSSPVFAERYERIFIWSEKMMDSDSLLLNAVRTFVSTSFHPAGTLRMGADQDELATVDQYCRVRGATNLRVVDASIMPKLPRSPLNLTCVMLGERAAVFMDGTDK